MSNSTTLSIGRRRRRRPGLVRRRARPVTGSRRTPGNRKRNARGTTTTVLAILLALLSGYSVFSSWHQTRLVRNVAAAGGHTGAYQQAAYLVSWEMALIQAALREPDGEERHEIPAVRDQAVDAMDRMTDIDTEVEDAAAVEALRAIGCDVAQGFHFSRPVPAEMLADRLGAVPVG